MFYEVLLLASYGGSKYILINLLQSLNIRYIFAPRNFRVQNKNQYPTFFMRVLHLISKLRQKKQ